MEVSAQMKIDQITFFEENEDLELIMVQLSYPVHVMDGLIVSPIGKDIPDTQPIAIHGCINRPDFIFYVGVRYNGG